MSVADAHRIAEQVAAQFGLLECDECAQAIQKALEDAGESGEWIEIRATGGHDMIVCIGYDNGMTSITQNGRHVGIRIGGVVFDNLHSKGLVFDQ